MTSVVIPYYKRNNTITRAVESCFHLRKLHEIIIVDDEKSVDSNRVLVSLSSQYSEIRILNNLTSGAYTARKYGLEKSNDNLIFFLDSDDIFLPSVSQVEDYLLLADQDAILIAPYYVDTRLVQLSAVDSSTVVNSLGAAPFSSIAFYNKSTLELPADLNLKLKAYQDDDFLLKNILAGRALILSTYAYSRLNTDINETRISTNYYEKHKSFILFAKDLFSFSIPKLMKYKLVIAILLSRALIVFLYFDHHRFPLSKLLYRLLKKTINTIVSSKFLFSRGIF
jgi:glycosyltransferase involved in cell wall biosynthesis